MDTYSTTVNALIREHLDTDTQGECLVTTEAEIGLIQWQSKECQGSPATT